MSQKRIKNTKVVVFFFFNITKVYPIVVNQMNPLVKALTLHPM